MSINCFDTEVAKLVGITPAVIYQNIQFWCDKNRANNKHCYEGRYWTYNSTRAFADLFPYLTERQIRTALKKLEDNGLLVTANFNKSAYDRTRWYSVNSIEQNSKIDLTKKVNGSAQNVQPIPDSKHRYKTQIVNKEHSHAEAVTVLFDHWVNVMGKQKSKLTGKRSTRIKARLSEGYSVDDIKLAIDNCARSAWHNGKNDRNQVYNDIELICRSGDKLERFRDMQADDGLNNLSRSNLEHMHEFLKG